MSVTLSHTVKIGGVQSPTDFTSRVLGFSVSQRARPQRINGNTAVITLNNNDGALTPNAGGSYDSVDWFAQGVFISSTVNGGSSQAVFHGLVDDFQLADDGTQSTVTITALDWVAVAGRLPADNWTNINFYTGPGSAAATTLTEAFGNYGSDLPYLGTSGTTSNIQQVANDASLFLIVVNMPDDEYISDTLTGGIMPTDLCAIYGGEMYYNSAGAGSVEYQSVTVGNRLTRNTATYNEFTLTGGTPAAGELPLADVVTGYNTEELVNVVNSTRTGGTTQTAVNAASVNAYGSRTFETNSNLCYDDAGALAGAQNMVNRLGVSRFTAQRLYFDSGQLANTPAGSATQLETLLNVGTALWQPAVITYTPTGATSTTTESVLIYGRQLRVIPGRTSFVLDVLPAADYQSFKLNSSALGVLDQNRLG